MKRPLEFPIPPGWDASPSQGYPSIKFAGIHFYTWMEGGTVSVMPKTDTTQCPQPGFESGRKRTNHVATPRSVKCGIKSKFAEM